MTNLKMYSIGLLACIISFSIGKFSTKPEIKKEIITVNENKKTNTDRTVNTKRTELPDGTKITETVSTTKRTTDTEKVSEKKSETKTENRPNWLVSLAYFPTISNYQDKKYVLSIQKRILSEAYFGVSVSDKKEVGLSITLGF